MNTTVKNRNILLLSIMLIVILMCNINSSLALAVNKDIPTCKIINKNCIEIIDKGVISTLTFYQDEDFNVSKVTISKSNTSKLETLSIDRSNNILTSTITNEKISIPTDPNNESISLLAVGDITYKKISFATIKKAVGIGGSLADIAAAIIILCGVAVATPATAVLALIGGISGLTTSVMEGSKNHGIKLKLKEGIRKTTKGGKVYEYTEHKIVGVEVY